MALSTGQLLDHDVEAAGAGKQDVVRSPVLHLDAAMGGRRRWLKLGVDSELTTFVFAPNKNFCILDYRWRYWGYLLHG